MAVEDLQTARQTGDERKIREAEEKVQKAEEKVQKAEEKVEKAKEEVKEAEEQVTAVLELPAANHGWIPEPPSLLVFRTQCMQIPDETRHVAWPQNLEEELHFFTDGSCLAPTSSTGRLASWG